MRISYQGKLKVLSTVDMCLMSASTDAPEPDDFYISTDRGSNEFIDKLIRILIDPDGFFDSALGRLMLSEHKLPG